MTIRLNRSICVIWAVIKATESIFISSLISQFFSGADYTKKYSRIFHHVPVTPCKISKREDMIIFDRFLCCVKLKLFGKVIGWTGLMISLMIAYATFLVAGGRKSAGQNAPNEVLRHLFNDEDFYYYSALVIALLLIIAVFHIMLICGIKYRKSMLIVPYVIVAVVITATMICLLPSEIHLTASNGQDATSPYLIVACIFALIFIAYLALCIYSLYGLINYEEKRRKLYKSADTILITPLQI
ncbi:hypothetical protein ACKWTF_013848 [Chironomus riparius]